MAILNNCCRSSPFNTMDRRKLILWGGVGAVSAIILIIIIAVAATSSSGSAPRGSDALYNTPLIDGHNDLPNSVREKLKNKIAKFEFDKNLENDTEWGSICPFCATDLVRLKQGKVGGQFWVAYVDCKTQYRDAVAETFEQIDLIRRLIHKYPKQMQLVTTADGIMEAFQNEKLASLIAVEGGHSMDSRTGVLRMFYELGVRYMTLTHTCSTPWADASPVKDPKLNLTEYGKKVIREMNRLGMMVDLSHVHRNVMVEAIRASSAPVIFSHSCAYAIHNHHRNVPDDVLDQLKTNGGLVMVSFYTDFLAENTSPANIATVIQHINHIADRIGPDHVGIGSDFDGMSSPAAGLEDVSKYPDLFDKLYLNDSDKWSISNLEKLAGKNLIRVFKRVEEVSQELAEKEGPMEDWIPKADMILPADVKKCRTALDVDDTAVLVMTTDYNKSTLTTETAATTETTMTTTTTTENNSTTSNL